MHEIEVRTISSEEADHGVAELWANGEQIGYTRFEASDLVLRIEPRRDGSPLEVGVGSLSDALDEARRLIASF
jgi:hypothetical protein